MSTKLDFAKWFLSLGGAASWYGADKVNSWANGSLQSVTYDRLFAQYNAGNSASVIAEVQRHTGQAIPDQFQNWKNNTEYTGVINFLNRELVNLQNEQQNIHGTVDDTPLANQAISDDIVRTQQALSYYKQLAG